MLTVFNKGNRLPLMALRVLRAILATLLLIALLWSIVPVTFASSPMCTLACCAGRRPHASDSCIHGLCHASPISHARASHVHRQVPAQQSERLCGLVRITGRTTVALGKKSTMLPFDISSELRRARHPPEAERVSTALGKPCQPDCCAGTFRSSSQSRPRDTGAISHADKPRPPSSALHEHSSFSRAQALDALCRRSRPRGPPISSS